MSEATVKVRVGGERVIATAEGNGPVNALDEALRVALSQHFPQLAGFELADYKVRILEGSHGTGAITRVLVETRGERRHATGSPSACTRTWSRPAGTRSSTRSRTGCVREPGVYSGLNVVQDLVAHVREAFGWGEEVVASAGPRGALGQIWRLDVGSTRYALKEIFAEPPSEALIAAELTFTRQAAAAGVRMPASHPDRYGRHLLTTPAGTWLRLYDWVDLAPLDLTARATPRALGALLARLHRCAPAATVEPRGGPPDPWYDRVPAAHEWMAVTASGTPWSARLVELLTTLPELCAAVTPADPAELIVCHRDLHPENVLADPTGALVVIDWDNLGPAAPGRELARVLFDWFIDRSSADLDAVRMLYEAYVEEGGPGRIIEPADFSMLIASRLNFLLVQARVALDPEAEPRHREWAEREIDEALTILPTPKQLATVLAVSVRS